MVELWFALLCFMLIVFVVLDGWDIGAGALHLIVARTDAERREVIAGIGPFLGWQGVGWSPLVARSSWRFQRSWRPRSRASILGCGWSSGRSSYAGSRSRW